MLDAVGGSSLLFERLLEVVPWLDGEAVLVSKLQCEVSNHPEKVGEDGLVLLGVQFCVLVLQLDVFGEVDDQTQLSQSCLVDVTHAVEHEKATQQDCQRENLNIVVLGFVEGTKPFSVNHKHTDRFAVGLRALDRLGPEPKSLGAGVDGGADVKAVRSVKKDAIEQVAFTCPVHACYCAEANSAFYLLNYGESFWVEDEFYFE